MANNPYAEFDDDGEAAPIAAAVPETPPPSIFEDRGAPTTKGPKKKKRGVIIAVIAIIIGAMMVVGFFGLFFVNAMKKRSADRTENVKADPGLAKKDTEGPDLGTYQARVKQDMEEQEKRRLKAEAESLRLKQEADAQAGNKPDAGSAGATAANAAPNRGRYGDSRATATSSKDKKEMSPEELAAQRRFDGGVLWDEGGSGGGSEVGVSKGGASGGAASRNSARAAPASFEERLKANPMLAKYAAGGASESAGSGGSGGAGSSSESIGSMLETETYAAGTATMRPDLKFLLINGTVMPCTLIPRIVTTYPGETHCMINRDIYSADGSVLLVPKGSKARGERKVAVAAGATMVYATWGSIETEDGVIIKVDSMAADQLGAAGIAATIDNHYGQRFGGAILLSFLDDVFQAMANSAGNSEVTFDSSTNNGQDMASMALENSINIPPTGYVQHATELNIIVARDVDFRSVYGVR